MRVTYISWAPHCSRSDHTARELGGTSHMVYWGWLGSRPATVLLKYLGQTLSTWRVLMREQPDAVFVMSPPPVAIVAVYPYCVLRRIPFVIDAHTGAFLKRWQLFQRAQFWLARRAAATIVTNEHLRNLVIENGGRAVVLPDVPVEFTPTDSGLIEAGRFTVVCVTSFDRDEPIASMLEAARRLPEVRFFMTGNPTKAAALLPAPLPANLTLTGFLDTPVYGRLLRDAGVVMALTIEQHTMQRGAYEAIYQGTPVIVSDNPLLREAFDEGAVYVDNSPAAIVSAVQVIQTRSAEYRVAASRLRSRKLERWRQKKAELTQLVNGGPRSR